MRLHRAAMVIAVLALAACGRPSGTAAQIAVAIEKGDICTVCGMNIAGEPGPRAEAYVAGVAKPVKFGSTRDFFAFVTQPDMAHQIESLYVQDTARIDWAHPSSAPASFVDARNAYYVGWQPLAGEMGPTFASFARQADAEAFVRNHGGALLRFDQITAGIVSALAARCPPAADASHEVPVPCVTKINATSKEEPKPSRREGAPNMNSVAPSQQN